MGSVDPSGQVHVQYRQEILPDLRLFKFMGEAHTVWHEIISILGVKQCTATQMLGICLEFWVGAGVALGILKLRTLYKIKNELVQLKSQKLKKKKSKKRKNKRRGK